MIPKFNMNSTIPLTWRGYAQRAGPAGKKRKESRLARYAATSCIAAGGSGCKAEDARDGSRAGRDPRQCDDLNQCGL